MWKLEDSLKEFDINTNIDFGRENCNLNQSNIKVISRNDNSSKLIDDYFTFSKKKDNNNEENTSEKSIETLFMDPQLRDNAIHNNELFPEK